MDLCPRQPASRPRGINALLYMAGLDSLRWKWYTDTRAIGQFHLALIPVIIAASWQLIGYTMAMYLAGCAASRRSCGKLARVDGA